jgi:hypothetical protein
MAKSLFIITTFAIATTALGRSDTAPDEAALTLDAARQILADPRASGPLGLISLAGFEFSREVEVGHGIRVIAVSCNLAGGLAAFRPDGSRLATVLTNQITWLQLFDLNEDGVSDLITEEIESSGTGVLKKSFCLYAVSPQTIKLVWRGRSYVREAPWNPSSNAIGLVKEEVGFLRLDPSGAGKRARMTYLFPTSDGRAFEERIVEMEGEALKERGRAVRSNR